MDTYLESLKEQAKCYLCNNTLVKPKLVNCFHAFCTQCIRQQYIHGTDEVERQDYIFKCPQCDSETPLQCLNDVDNIPISPLHSRILKDLQYLKSLKICSGPLSSRHEATCICLDCERDPSLCDECLHHHSKYKNYHKVVSLSKLKKEEIDKLLNRGPLCTTHNKQNLKIFCQDCDMQICDLCLNEHHQNHKTIAMQDIIANENDSLSKNLEQIDRMSTNEQEKKEQQQIAMTIVKNGEKAEQEVIEFAEKLVTTILNYEQQLLNEIQVKKSKAERNLRIISNPTRAQEYVKNVVENSAASELIGTKNSKSFQNVTHYEPFHKTTGEMEFKPNEDLCEQVHLAHRLGLIQFFESSIKVMPSDLKAKMKAKLVVEIKTLEGENLEEPLENVSLQFAPKDNAKSGEMQIAENGEITVDFIPHVPGQLTVDVKLNGKPVCTSPLIMVVKPQQIREVTEKTKLKDAINNGSKLDRNSTPGTLSGITANKENSKIAVADCTSHCIRVYNMEGDLLLTYGSLGSGQGQLNGPRGLAFLNETDLVVADHYNHRLCIINTNTGQLVRTFGRKGNGYGWFKHPRGVHVDDDENIIVCDHDNRRLQVFTKDGDYLYQFSVPVRPRSAVKHNGLFYVSGGSVVHVIKMTDNQPPTTVTTIGGKDYTDGHLQCPHGLAIDSDDNILICEYSVCLIYKFTLDGRYVGQSGELENKPFNIAVLNNDQVICTSMKGSICFDN